MVVPGDEVHVRGGERERIVVVQRTVVKRVGAPVAVACYLDRSPAPLPKEHVASPVSATAARAGPPSATAG